MATIPRIQPQRTGNHLLDSLEPVDFRHVAGNLERVRLPLHHVFFRADDPLEHLYFPVSAVISLLVLPSHHDHHGIEIATVGKEGMAGFTALFGVPTSFYQATCRVTGDCLRLPVSQGMKAMARPAVAMLLNRYAAVAYRMVIQAAVCNALHQIEQRLCRWLLATQVRAGNEFPATQDGLAMMLGVKRPTISVVAASLQKAGIITYHRGHIRILDRIALEQSACPCFQVTKSIFERVMEQ